jgi:prephenate dehydrogenase
VSGVRRPDVTIVGLGLIGGSLARALTRAGWQVAGVDRPEVLRRARAARAIVSSHDDLAAAVAQARIVVLAAPPRTNLRLLHQVARRLAPTTVVTDLGSVKTPICRAARDLGLRSFVGGHPMAGSERQGWEASQADLFAGHPWILTPDGSSPAAVARVRRLVRAAGGQPHRMTPAEHDRTVAYLSHMPQLVAWAIDDAARRDGVAMRHLGLAGPGFRDMTRLARSPRPLWREILAENRGSVAKAMRALARSLRRRV